MHPHCSGYASPLSPTPSQRARASPPAPWRGRYCCPKNLTVHSTYLGDVSPGEEWLGLFNLTDAETYETVSRNVATGLETKLSCPRQGRNFNWADATLEVYNVNGYSYL